MTHLDTEIQQLKESLLEMWSLVLKQCYKSEKAIERFDKDLAREILANEKRVDAFELKINMDCERILALFNPVANDLRFVLSVLRINAELERVGDYARTLAKVIKDVSGAFKAKEIADVNLVAMSGIASNMLQSAYNAFEQENIELLRPIFKHDEELDRMNKNALSVIARLIKEKPEEAENLLELLLAVQRIERMGDQAKAIAEEIVFYLEAKVIRHQKNKDRLI
ncbi:MAG: phosphate signaling complex protein PhoU [Bacteroidales bacterium]|nr:phosphate signaling complex protein PhoU [Bacteroidales bacterium]